MRGCENDWKPKRLRTLTDKQPQPRKATVRSVPAGCSQEDKMKIVFCDVLLFQLDLSRASSEKYGDVNDRWRFKKKGSLQPEFLIVNMSILVQAAGAEALTQKIHLQQCTLEFIRYSY